MPDQQPLSASAAFFATLWGKILAVLAAITMMLGIYLEIVQAWRATNEGFITGEQAKVAPQMQPAASAATVADAQIKEATAQEALRRQKAEADEAVARACNARMQQLTQNMYLDDFNGDGTVKPGSRTARMMELYDKDCNPAAAAAAPADSSFDGAMQSYQGIKKLALEPNAHGQIKFDDQDASTETTCLIGVRVSTGLQLGDKGSDGMVGESLAVCSGAARVQIRRNRGHLL